MLNHLNAHDWTEFERRWPAAHAYLLHQGLIGEREALHQEHAAGIADKRRRDWVEARLMELDAWYEDAKAG